LRKKGLRGQGITKNLGKRDVRRWKRGRHVSMEGGKLWGEGGARREGRAHSKLKNSEERSIRNER